VTILGPPINRRQDAFGHTHDPVNLGVDFLGPCIAPEGKDSAISGGQAHGLFGRYVRVAERYRFISLHQRRRSNFGLSNPQYLTYPSFPSGNAS